jgi:micrococcal nuclease
VLVRVERALDGDSLLLSDGRQVRLIGINTPEFGKNGTAAQPLATEAREFVNALTRRQAVQLLYDIERSDRHRRMLAYAVLTDGRDVQAALLRAGLAWVVAIPPNTARLSEYRAAEAEARAARRGVWGRAEYEPVAAAQLTSAHAGFIRVTGVVEASKRRHYATELTLAPGVRLLIPHESNFFPAPASLVGKRVLARGWLTAYKNDLSLRVTHPAMLELIP